MSSCCRYAGSCSRYWLYGSTACVSAPKKSPYQTPMQAEQHRQVPLERRRPEVLVHRAEPGEHLAESLRSDGDHQRQPDRRVEAVAPADPVPEPEHVLGVDPELGDLVRVGRHGDEVLARRHPSPSASTSQARAVLRVGQGLDGGERLRATMNSVSAGSRSRSASADVGAVDVGHEPERQSIGLSSRASASYAMAGPRSEPPMPMFTTLRMRLAGVARPPAGPHPVGELAHAVEHRVHLGHDVLPVDLDDLVVRGARRATCSTARSSVVLILLDRRTWPRSAGRGRPAPPATPKARPSRRHPVLRIVEEQVGGLDGEGLAAIAVVRKQGPKVNLPDRLVMTAKGLPLRRLGDAGHGSLRRIADTDRGCPRDGFARETLSGRPVPRRRFGPCAPGPRTREGPPQNRTSVQIRWWWCSVRSSVSS